MYTAVSIKVFSTPRACAAPTESCRHTHSGGHHTALAVHTACLCAAVWHDAEAGRPRGCRSHPAGPLLPPHQGAPHARAGALHRRHSVPVPPGSSKRTPGESSTCGTAASWPWTSTWGPGYWEFLTEHPPGGAARRVPLPRRHGGRSPERVRPLSRSSPPTPWTCGWPASGGTGTWPSTSWGAHGDAVAHWPRTRSTPTPLRGARAVRSRDRRDRNAPAERQGGRGHGGGPGEGRCRGGGGRGAAAARILPLAHLLGRHPECALHCDEDAASGSECGPTRPRCSSGR